MPHSLAYSSMPFLAPPDALDSIFILPTVPFSMALKARTMAASRSLSLTAWSSSGVMEALMELWIPLSARPTSVAYLTPKALTSGAEESMRNGSSLDTPANQSISLAMASLDSATIWFM